MSFPNPVRALLVFIQAGALQALAYSLSGESEGRIEAAWLMYGICQIWQHLGIVNITLTKSNVL